MVVKPYSVVVTTFFLKLQFNGLYGSSGPSKVTMTSGPVFASDSGCANGAIGRRERIVARAYSARSGRIEDRLLATRDKARLVSAVFSTSFDSNRDVSAEAIDKEEARGCSS